MDTINASNPSNKLSAIDRALAAAQARKNMKPSEAPEAPATASKAKTRVVDTDKAAEKAADRKSTRLNSSHVSESRMPSSA